MTATVLLEGLRCSGSAHGGYQARCLLYLKEEWLRPVSHGRPAARPGRGTTGATKETLHTNSGPRMVDGTEVYNCEATFLGRSSHPIHWWDFRHFVRDIASGNAKATAVIRYLLPYVFNTLQTWSKVRLPSRSVFRNGMWYPFVRGTQNPTPRQQLGLQPGSRVRVKDREAVQATLGPTGHNRGLSFDVEMLEHCGREAEVKTRVERVIDEETRRRIEIKGGCLILEDMMCSA